VFFLPKKRPEFNPDEQVWNELKNNRLGKQPVKNKTELRARLESTLKSLQQQTDRIRSFSSCRKPNMPLNNVRILINGTKRTPC